MKDQERTLPGTPAHTVAPDLHEQVREVIDLIRPSVQDDGGDIELVSVADDGVVQIRFHGACIGCPSSSMTLQMGIDRCVRDKVPQVTQVIAVP